MTATTLVVAVMVSKSHPLYEKIVPQLLHCCEARVPQRQKEFEEKRFL